MKFRINIRQWGMLTLFPVCAFSVFAQKQKKNILFLMADDFNYWNRAQGYYPQAQTPNIDKLASKGILFTNAHCSSPVSNPSRNALWSGFRPSTTGIQGNQDGYVRDIHGFENIKTMNQYFMEQGYWVFGAGKLYHPGSMADGPEKDQKNWSERYQGGTGSSGGNYISWKNPGWSAMSYNINPAPMTEENCEDFKMVNEVARIIQSYAESDNKDKPFFIGCGVFRPHLPWNLPKEFWDKFKTEDLTLPRGYKVGDLDDMPGYSATSAHQGVVENSKWKESIHAYLAALALADSNIGVLLDALEKTPYKENTIICFMGDHGWHLGEKERWGKNTLFDAANRTTLIIYDPSAKGNGKVSSKVVSLQDIYPTLVEISGLPIKTDIEGNSLAPLLESPDRADWQAPVIMSYRGTDYIKTNQWRYVRDARTNQQMLFDVQKDPYEFTNLRSDKKLEPVVNRLSQQLDSMISIGKSLKNKLLANYEFFPEKLTIPGRIEAEDYDEGGYNQTYLDGDQINRGGKYRIADGVDIFLTNDVQGSFQIGDVEPGEWWTYTVKDFTPGNYEVDIRVNNPLSESVEIELYNQNEKLGHMQIPPTKGLWKTLRMKNVYLDLQPTARLRFKIVKGKGLLINWYHFESKNVMNPKIAANSNHKYISRKDLEDGILKLDLTDSDPYTKLTIFDQRGKQLSEEIVSGEQMLQYKIPVKLLKGDYMLRVSNDNTSSVESFYVL